MKKTPVVATLIRMTAQMAALVRLVDALVPRCECGAPATRRRSFTDPSLQTGAELPKCDKCAAGDVRWVDAPTAPDVRTYVKVREAILAGAQAGSPDTLQWVGGEPRGDLGGTEGRQRDVARRGGGVSNGRVPVSRVGPGPSRPRQSPVRNGIEVRGMRYGVRVSLEEEERTVMMEPEEKQEETSPPVPDSVPPTERGTVTIPEARALLDRLDGRIASSLTARAGYVAFIGTEPPGTSELQQLAVAAAFVRMLLADILSAPVYIDFEGEISEMPYLVLDKWIEQFKAISDMSRSRDAPKDYLRLVRKISALELAKLRADSIEHRIDGDMFAVMTGEMSMRDYTEKGSS